MKKEKGEFLDTLVASRKKLSDDFLNALNAKIEFITSELNTLYARRDIIEKEYPPEADFYKKAIEILSQLRKTSEDLTKANDPVALRQVLVAGIEKIQLTKDGDFQIYGSSPNCKGWYPGEKREGIRIQA